MCLSMLLTALLATLLAGAAPPDPKAPRKPHPLAPSLPQLTDEEEAQLDRIVERFIQFDIGNLPGAEGQKAKLEFDRLGPEATFALIRGLNRAAQIDHSCPVLVIARKLNRIMAASSDGELLQFARENIGAGVGRTQHAGILTDLRNACVQRQRLVARNTVAAKPGAKAPRSMTTAELAEAAGTERGPRLKELLIELEQRRGDEVIAALASAADSQGSDAQPLARQLLARHLARQTAAVLKEKVKDERPEVRVAAVQAIGAGQPALSGELIDRLTDSDASVRAVAQQALVRFNRGFDYGPRPNASKAEQEAAVKKWREWWARQR